MLVTIQINELELELKQFIVYRSTIYSYVYIYYFNFKII